jgi:hypothetical protein
MWLTNFELCGAITGLSAAGAVPLNMIRNATQIIAARQVSRHAQATDDPRNRRFLTGFFAVRFFM